MIMKKLIFNTIVAACLISMTFIWQACQKEPYDIESEVVELSFNVVGKSSSGLKSAPATDLQNAEKVILTVQKEDGSPTDYTQYELDIHKLGNAYITKKIMLPFGDYKLTEFYIIDCQGSIIFASPLEGSLLAQHVADPLPIMFNISEKKSKAVEVEVISTESLNPKDFGLVRFPVTEVETFQFIISVSELGTDKLLSACLTITSGSYSYSQGLDTIADNIITIKDGFEEYVLNVESYGYYNCVATITNIELKAYDSTPLIVELIKIPEIVFASDRDGNYELYSVFPDGSGLERLTYTSYEEGLPRWSPDRSKIAFSSSRDGNLDIYLMNHDGNNIEKITQSMGNIHYFSWSPDGTKIVYQESISGDHEFFILNLNNQVATQITFNDTAKTDPEWTPNGELIIYAQAMTPNNPIGNCQIFSMHPDGTNVTRLTHDSYDNRNARVSPNNDKIVFNSSRDGNTYCEKLWIADFNVTDGVPTISGDYNLVTTGRHQKPSWSPDGSKIVFAYSTSCTWNTNIYIIDSDGTNLQPLTENIVSGGADWGIY